MTLAGTRDCAVLAEESPVNVTLPGLLGRAGQRLLDARNSAEVLEAKAIAEAALHYARVTLAANDTHADCLRIITRAEMRMADEIDSGQANGEVRTRADNQHVQSVDKPASYEELGISRQRVAEWRETRDAGEAVVEQAIDSALAEGRAPTKSDIQKHVRGTFGTGDNQWFTPAEWIERARAAMGGIDCDPASHELAQNTVKANAFHTESDDGLAHEWRDRVWLNPPYAQPLIERFIDKLLVQFESGWTTQAILLTHNYTDTAWFQKAAARARCICFPRGRIRFVSPSGELAAPTQGQAFFYFGVHPRGFYDAFMGTGFIVEPRA